MPSPPPKKIRDFSPTWPIEGDDHWPWNTRELIFSFSRATSRPSCLSSAMKLGDSGMADLAVVDAVGRAYINAISAHQRRTACGVVRKHGQLVEHVELPDDVAVALLGFHRFLIRLDRVVGLVGERPLVAVGHAVGVHAQHVAAVGHDVHAVAVDGWRGTDAQVHLVEVFASLAFIEFGHDQLPEPFAGGFVETQQQSAAG